MSQSKTSVNSLFSTGSQVVKKAVKVLSPYSGICTGVRHDDSSKVGVLRLNLVHNGTSWLLKICNPYVYTGSEIKTPTNPDFVRNNGLGFYDPQVSTLAGFKVPSSLATDHKPDLSAIGEAVFSAIANRTRKGTKPENRETVLYSVSEKGENDTVNPVNRLAVNATATDLYVQKYYVAKKTGKASESILVVSKVAFVEAIEAMKQYTSGMELHRAIKPSLESSGLLSQTRSNKNEVATEIEIG
jgi:hypothetical protein